MQTITDFATDRAPTAAIFDPDLRDNMRWALQAWVDRYVGTADYIQREFRVPVDRLHDHELVELLADALDMACKAQADRADRVGDC